MARTDLIYAIDVSNYQAAETSTPEALSALLDKIQAETGNRPSHLVVRAGLACEHQSLRDIATAQIQAGLALGMTYSLYGWAYSTYPGDQTVRDMTAQWQSATTTPPAVYWADLEDSPPVNWNWIMAYISECMAEGVQYYGVYTGFWWFDAHAKDWDLQGVWLWDANYNGGQDLEVQSFNGMVLVAHQYSDKLPDGSGLDLDVFTPLSSGYPCA